MSFGDSRIFFCFGFLWVTCDIIECSSSSSVVIVVSPSSPQPPPRAAPSSSLEHQKNYPHFPPSDMKVRKLCSSISAPSISSERKKEKKLNWNFSSLLSFPPRPPPPLVTTHIIHIAPRHPACSWSIFRISTFSRHLSSPAPSPRTHTHTSSPGLSSFFFQISLFSSAPVMMTSQAENSNFLIYLIFWPHSPLHLCLWVGALS